MAIRTPGRRQATAASAPVDEDAWIEVAGLQKLYRPRRSEPTHALSDIGFTVRRGSSSPSSGPPDAVRPPC